MQEGKQGTSAGYLSAYCTRTFINKRPSSENIQQNKDGPPATALLSSYFRRYIIARHQLPNLVNKHIYERTSTRTCSVHVIIYILSCYKY